jgi:radical SAM superfamily enzyme YgiQ (UPF0313 family)
VRNRKGAAGLSSAGLSDGRGVSAPSVVLIYPNAREVAFASLGFLKVFEMLKSRVGVADVSYLPSSRLAPARSKGLSRRPGGAPGWGAARILSPKQNLLLGHFTGREVRSFDIVAFSVSYENDFVHVPEILLGSGIEPRAAARTGPFPLVIFGGFVMSLNPLPIADFADAVVVGEAERVIDPMLLAVSRAQETCGADIWGVGADRSGPEGAPGRAGKAGLLRLLSDIPGVWVPSLGQVSVKRVWAPVGEIASEPRGEPPSHFGDMHLVEVGRGCGRGCLFCAAGNLYRPVRMRDTSTVLAQAGRANKVGLVGTAVGDHPALASILRDLTAAGRKVGISSFRADEMTPEIADLLVGGGVKTLAIAPEAGSEALRQRINKNISDRQLEVAVKVLAAAGIENIKLYFMVGLPWETDEDVEAAVDLVARLARVRGRARLAVAVGPFVPKPHTAFQWCGFEDLKVLKRRVAIFGGVRRLKGVSLKVGSLAEAWLEAVLARGDGSLGELLLEAAEKRVPLKQLVRARPGLDPARALDMEKPLPWDFIDAGVSGKRLREAFLRAQRTPTGPSRSCPTSGNGCKRTSS